MENKINIFNKPTRPISIGSVGNAVLQGNQVKITFPKAIDKTNYSKEIDEIEYQVRLSMYPILLTKTSTAPIEALKDATAVGSWTTLRGIKEAGTTDLNAIITIPNYITDALVGVEVRAVDDYKRTPTESVTIPSILSIANTKPAISAGTTEWTETSLKLFYNVNDLGLLKLANNGAMLDAPSSFNASYIAYRNEVIKWLGDISFSLDVTFEGSGASKTVTNELFKLSSYDLLNTTKSITLLHSATGVNKDKGYTVTSSLTKKGALSTSKAVLLNAHSGESDAVIHLTASTPSLQIGKTGILVKLNEDQLDDTKAAGVFGRSEMHGVAGDSTKGASIALIDNRKGSSGLSLDQPALGFYANDDTEIGRIVAQEVDNGKYLAIKQQNFDPLYIRKSGTKLEYWEQGANAGKGDWFTLLPEVMTTQMNADAQWNFDPSKPTTFRLGDSFYYKEGSGVILGNGLKIKSGGIDVPIEEYLNNSVITKQVRVSSSHSLIAIDEVREPIITNDTITITATATYDTTLTWTAKGFKGSTPTTLTVTPTNNKVTTTAKAIAPYDRVEYTVTSADGAADSVVISSIMQTESGAVTIDKTTEYYAANSTGIVPKRSDAVWNTDISKVLGTAKYIYNYFVIEKTNDYDYVSKPRMISSNGTAIPNTIRATRYYKRVNSGTVIPTSADTGWMNTLVQPTSDYKWLWTYLKPTSGTNFLDETYRTELIAIYGKISTPEIILHTAYADDDRGSNFSLVQGVRKYMGIYSSTAVEQSTAPSDYEWSLIKGEDGADGADGEGFTWNLLKGSNELKSTSAETAVYIPRTYVENGVTHYEVIKQNLTTNHYVGYRGEVLYSDLPKVFTVSFEVMLNDVSEMTIGSYLGTIGCLEASGARTTYTDLLIKNIGVELKENIWQKVVINVDETLFPSKTSTFDINKIERIYVSLGQYFNGKVTFRKLMFNGGTVASNYAPHITEIYGQDGNWFTWNILENGHLDFSKITYSPPKAPFLVVRDGTKTELIDNTIIKIYSSAINGAQRIERRFSPLELGFYTYSVRIRISNTSLVRGRWMAPQNAIHTDKVEDIKVGEWQIISIPFEVNVKDTNLNVLRFYLPSLEIGASVEFDWEKLEKGISLNPTWSPHVSEINGKDGVDGAPGKGIKDTKYRYAKTSAPSPEPTESQWSPTKPTYNKGDYAWTQVIWEYSDGTSENSAPMMSYIAEDGVGISDTLVAYALSTTNVQPADNLFNPEVPDSKPGDYVWTRVTLDYTNPDKTDTKFYTVARVGKDGVDAKLISLSASEQIFKNNTPTSITVTGLTQNTSITSWTYSSNSAAFTTTLPAGVTRSGNVVTITQSTMTANTLTIKASDGTYSDTVTIAKVKDGSAGMNGFTVILTNESQTFPANSSGTVTSYANGYSDIVVYYGSTALTCTSTNAAAPTVNNTYTVTSIAATSGTVTTTPSLASSNYRITPSALNTDNAIRTITIVARVNGVNYTFKKVLTYTKSKSGATGAPGQTSYLHIAYANAPADVATFSTTNSLNKRYIGQYTDFKKEGSNKPGDYEWSLIKGADGKDGSNSTWNILKDTKDYQSGNWNQTHTRTEDLNGENVIKWNIKSATVSNGTSGAGQNARVLLKPDTEYVYQAELYSPNFDINLSKVLPGQILHLQFRNGTTQTSPVKYEMLSKGILQKGTWGVIANKFKTTSTNDFTVAPYLYGAGVQVGLPEDTILYVKNLKLSETNSITDWTPAVGDVITTTEFNTYQETTDSTIQDYVEKTEIKTGDNASSISRVSSDVLQEADRVTKTFKIIEENVKDNKRTLETITATIRDGVDASGKPYTEWGKEGDSNVMRIKNTGLYLLSNNIETIKLEDGKAYAEELHVTERIGFGNHTAQKHGTEFTIFAWTGGTK